jgi:hypothetical protein
MEQRMVHTLFSKLVKIAQFKQYSQLCKMSFSLFLLLIICIMIWLFFEIFFFNTPLSKFSLLWVCKHYNNGRDINFPNLLKYWMDAEFLQYLHTYFLKDVVEMSAKDQVFIGCERFQFMTKILKLRRLSWQLSDIIQACYLTLFIESWISQNKSRWNK